jgi:replicative DNA helicase
MIDGRVSAYSIYLGSCLSDGSICNRYIDKVKEEWILSTEHRRVFVEMRKLFNNDLTPDILLLSQECQGVDITFVSELCELSATESTLERVITNIRDNYYKHQLTQGLLDAHKLSTEPNSTASEIQSKIETLSQVVKGESKALSTRELMADTFRDIYIASKTHGLVGMPTGFKGLDECINGFCPSKLTIIGGRPSSGKTTLSMNFCTAMAKEKHSGIYFSYETPTIEMVQKMIACEAKVNFQALSRGRLSSSAMENLVAPASSVVADMPIHLLYDTQLDVDSLIQVVRDEIREHNIKWVCVDYIQIVPVPSSMRNAIREQQVAYISQRLKSLGKYGVHVIALSQLSRGDKAIVNKKPTMSDLRESGAIEQDADTIIFPYRYGYGDPNADQNSAELIVAKNKNGALAEIKCRCDLEYFKFSEIEGGYYG